MDIRHIAGQNQREQMDWLGCVLKEYSTELQRDGKKQRWVGGSTADHGEGGRCLTVWQKGLGPNTIGYFLPTWPRTENFTCILLFNHHTVLWDVLLSSPHFTHEKTERQGACKKETHCPSASLHQSPGSPYSRCAAFWCRGAGVAAQMSAQHLQMFCGPCLRGVQDCRANVLLGCARADIYLP